MKIFQIIPVLKLAGAETMCENLCYALRNQGCEVIVVSLYSEQTSITKRLEEGGIRIFYLGKKRGFDFSIFIKLYQLMKEENPAVVHTHIYAARYALPVATFCGIPKIVHTVHNIAEYEQTKVGKIINKFMFKHCGVIPVALSKEIKKTVEVVYGLSADQIPVVFNGIDLSKCDIKEDYTRKEYFRILHIGRFMEVKNHALLIQCFSKFVVDHPDARLQLLGDGVLRKGMEQLVQKLGVSEFVEFAGVQSDVYPWLHNADIFILPSKFEGMPMTLIEAMGTGLPIIASAVGGILDMLTEGNDAILIEPKEQQVLKSLEQLYSHESTRKELGQMALQSSMCFSSESMAKKYIQIYE